MPETDPTPPLEDLTDEQLLGRHRGGDEQAFEVLIERYRLELFHFLARFVGNRTSADDIFQDAFIQVHISASTFDTSRRFKPWLFTIAANKARDYLRKNKRQKAVSLSASVDQDGGRAFIDLMEADLPLPQEKAQQKETAQIVRDIVSSLPEHLREVLLLAYFNKMAYREIAENLSIPLGTVKSRLHAAVGTFAELWKAQAKSDDE
jgi:RNA polymerase sigma-70 factor (ECF subfamily)